MLGRSWRRSHLLLIMERLLLKERLSDDFNDTIMGWDKNLWKTYRTGIAPVALAGELQVRPYADFNY